MADSKQPKVDAEPDRRETKDEATGVTEEMANQHAEPAGWPNSDRAEMELTFTRVKKSKA